MLTKKFCSRRVKMSINRVEVMSENTVLSVDQVRKSYGKKSVLKV